MGERGSLHWQRQKGAVGVAACLPPRSRSLVPSPAPRGAVIGHGVQRATNRPPLFSLACPRARRAARAVSLTSSRTQRRREGEAAAREDDARRGSDSPEMVASLDHGEVAINGETGVPFVLLTKLRARASARIAC